jgi:molecular chaperone DnaK
MKPRIRHLMPAAFMMVFAVLFGCREDAGTKKRIAKLAEAVGIETLGGVFTPLLSRNTSLPATVSETFSTADDNQESIEVAFFAGNTDSVRNARKLDLFVIDKVPKGPRGTPKIQVALSVDENGEVKVVARGLEGGKHQEATLGKVSVE